MLKMNDGMHFMFQGRVHGASMRFGWDLNCNRIYFNFSNQDFFYLLKWKSAMQLQKKNQRAAHLRLGTLHRTLLTRLSVAARFRLQFQSTFLKTPKQLHVPKYSWFMNV